MKINRHAPYNTLHQNGLRALRYEPWLFYLICILNLIPLFKYSFFPSLDGPAHLYNSQLIGSLWQGDYPLLEQYVAFNKRLVPNWSGHALMSTFNLFLPAYLAEKLTLIFYLLALPLAFRAILRQQAPHNVAYSYLAFPFTYTQVFCLGFFNFSIAVALCLLSVSYFMHTAKQALGIKEALLMAALITACYFSHIFVFAVLMGYLFGLLALQTIYALLTKSHQVKPALHHYLKRSAVLVLCALPTLYMFVQYLLQSPADGQPLYVSRQKLLKWLVELDPLVCYDGKHEGIYNWALACLLAFLLAVIVFSALYRFVVGRKTIKHYLTQAFQPVNMSLFLALILLVLYFNLPNFKSGAGFLSVRLLYLSTLLFILWLACRLPTRWLLLLCVPLVFWYIRGTASYRKKQLGEMNKLAKEYYQLGNKLEAGCVVLGINANTNWMFGHFSNYLGVEKPIIILDNYECDLDYFPLMWNTTRMPNNCLGPDDTNRLCFTWKRNTQQTKRLIDYVFINGNIHALPDTCQAGLHQTLSLHYQIVYESSTCSLYKYHGKH